MGVPPWMENLGTRPVEDMNTLREASTIVSISTAKWLLGHQNRTLKVGDTCRHCASVLFTHVWTWEMTHRAVQ